MKIRNEHLYKAMRAYVSAAIDFVAEKAKREGTSLQSDSNLESHWIHALYTGNLNRIPEYSACFKELTSDKIITKHFDANVGSHRQGTLTPTAENMMKHILDLGRRDGQYTFDAERFDREYSFFEETFYSDGLLCEAIAPLRGLSLIPPVVRLSDNLEIRRLDDEVKPYGAPSYPWDGNLCAVIAKYEVPKIIDSKSGAYAKGMSPEDRYAEIKKERAIEERINERIEDVINALRLFGNCDVYHSGIIHRSSKWLFIHSHGTANRMLGSGLFDCEFSRGRQPEAFMLLWNRLEDPKVKQNLDTVVRRFGYSCVRHRVEDKIIDLMIAAEALFLHGKKTYKKSDDLSLRAGLLLGTDRASREEVSNHMRKAYRLRNKVVHEGHLTPTVLEPEDGTVEEFVFKIGDYMQAAIIKAINLLSDPRTSDDLNDSFWDKLKSS